MDLTLSIDKKLLEQARKTAGAMGISLNEMVRQYLEKVAGTAAQGETFREFRERSLTRGGHSQGQVWTREDLHRG